MIKLAVAAGVVFALLAFMYGKKEELRSVELSAYFQMVVVNEKGEPLVKEVESVRTGFYWKDYSLYRFDPVIKFETNEPIKGTEKYFLVRGQSKMGYYFNPVKDSTQCVEMKADSLFDSWRWNMDRSKHASAFAERWIASKDKDSLSDLFYLKGKPADVNQPDSIILRFAKDYNDLPFSLQPGLDSLADMKFYEMRMVFGERRVDGVASVIPAREIHIRMRRIPVDDAEKEMRLIDHFRKACGL